MTPSNILRLIDLTSLNADDTPETIDALCEQAHTPQGNVAVVCVLPQFVALAKKRLATSTVKVATVNNFPSGLDTADTGTALEQIDIAIHAGADEIDTVMPRQLLLAGQGYNTLRFIQACRARCKPPVKLKVIIESGLLEENDIRLATRLCIAGRADFVKTSTGKVHTGATPQAVQAMCEVIKENNAKIGIKISGGVRTLAAAQHYLDIISNILGPNWISPETVRFGASRMLV